MKNQGFGLVLSSSSDFLDISCDGPLCESSPVLLSMNAKMGGLQIQTRYTCSLECCMRPAIGNVLQVPGFLHSLFRKQ